MRYQSAFLFDISQECIQLYHSLGTDIFKPVWCGGRVTFITKTREHILMQTTVLAKTILSSIPLLHNKDEYIYYICIAEGSIKFEFYRSLRDALVHEGILASPYDPRLFFITECNNTFSSVYICHFSTTSDDINKQQAGQIVVHDVMLEVAGLQITCSDSLSCAERHCEFAKQYLVDYSIIRSGLYSKDTFFSFIIERNGCIPVRLLVFQSEADYAKSIYNDLTIKDEYGELIEFQCIKQGSVKIESSTLSLKSLSEVRLRLDIGYYQVWVCFAGQSTIERECREAGDDFYCVFLVKR